VTPVAPEKEHFEHGSGDASGIAPSSAMLIPPAMVVAIHLGR